MKIMLKERWGWVVTVTSFCNFFIIYGVLFTYGLLYIALQEEFNTSNTETGWIGSLAISVTAIGTFISNRLLQKFSNRSVATVGVLMLAVACVSTSLMPTFLPIYFTYGLLVGLGINFILISSMNLIFKYFPGKNASRATAFAITGSTSGMLAMNPLVNLMITHLGWRNMLRIMGGSVLLIGLPCVSTFTEPFRSRLSSSSQSKTTTSSSSEDKTQNITNGNHKQLVEEKESFINDDNKSANHPKTNHERTNTEQVSQTDLEETDSVIHSKMTRQRTVREQLQILLFPELWFFTVATIITSAGQCFFYISFVSFVTMNGFEKDDAAFVMTTIAVAEVVGKLLLSAVGDNFPFPRMHLFNMASFMGVCVMFALFKVSHIWHLYCLATVIGLFMSVFDAVIFSISVDVFGLERNDEAIAILLIANGLGFLLGSLFGMSVDRSGSYDAAIYCCIGIYIAAIILYTAVPVYQKLFAKERYIMADFKNKHKQGEVVANPMKEITNETLGPQATYKRVSTV